MPERQPYMFVPPVVAEVYAIVGNDVKITMASGQIFEGKLKKVAPSGAWVRIKPVGSPYIEVPLEGSRVDIIDGR